MDIRSDIQKGLSYVELGRKYHIDQRTAKRYAESPQKPEYTLSESLQSHPAASLKTACLVFPHARCDSSQSSSNSSAASSTSGFTFSPWKSLPPVRWSWYFSVKRR